jgi:hypothetical protein
LAKVANNKPQNAVASKNNVPGSGAAVTDNGAATGRAASEYPDPDRKFDFLIGNLPDPDRKFDS